jgi:hypothetical protein
MRCDKCEGDYNVLYEITMIVIIHDKEHRDLPRKYCKFCLLDAAQWQVRVG